MHLLVDHGDPYHVNTGDAAMLRVLVERALSAGCRVSVLTAAAERASRFLPNDDRVAFMSCGGRNQFLFHAVLAGRSIPGLPDGLAGPARAIAAEHRKLSCPPLRQLGERVNTTGFSLPAMQQWLELVSTVDAVGFAGGGYLCESFGGAAALTLATAQAARIFGKPAAWFSQGLGPIDSAQLREIALECLSHATSISCRHPLTLSPELLPSGPSATFSGDDSLSLGWTSNALRHVEADSIGIALRTCNSIGDVDENFITLLAEEIADTHSLGLLHFVSKVAMPADLIEPAAMFAEAARCKVMLASTYHPALWCAAAGGKVIAFAPSEYYRRKFASIESMFPGSVVFSSRQCLEADVHACLAKPHQGQRSQEIRTWSDRSRAEFTRWVASLAG